MYKKRLRGIDSGKKSSFSKDKSGQVTHFIIIGLVLLLAIILLIVLQKEMAIFRPGEIFPTEKGKIESHITQCIEDIGDDALLQIGLTGGYINVPSHLTENSAAHLRISPFQVVPYWAYKNNVNIPSLNQIKSRIDLFMEEKLPGCLFEGELFANEYNVVERSKVESDVQILDEKIVFTVTYGIEVRNKEGTVIAELTDHTGESEVKLKWLHDTAKNIVEYELNDLKFEDLTVDLLSLEHDQVPMSGIELSCAKKRWDVERVKQTLKDMLRVNIGKVKVEGTDYVEFPESQPYYQHHYVWDILLDYPDVSVTFLVDDTFPFQFGVTPIPMQSGGLGGVSTSGLDVMSLICLQTWKFTYDVSYPVLVKLIDQTTGYIFNSAFTVHVHRNRGDRGAEYLIRTPVLVERFGDEEFCGNRRIPMTIKTYELIENTETGIYSREALPGTSLEFSCLKYGCSIGETFSDARIGPVSQYSGNFPYCDGGIVRGKKEGYKEDFEWIVTVPEKEVELELTPTHLFPAERISILKHELKSDGSIGESKPIAESELVSVRLFTNESTVDHEHRWAYSPSEVLGELEFLGRTDFTYDLELQLFSDKEMIGGYIAEWTVDWETLADASEIVFHVITKKSFDNEADQFMFIGGIEDYSKLIPSPEIR